MKAELRSIEDTVWRSRFLPIKSLTDRVFSRVLHVKDTEFCIETILKIYDFSSMRQSERVIPYNELEALLALQSHHHSSIIRLLDVFVTAGKVCLEFEYMAGGSLLDRFHAGLNSDAALNIAIQMCAAVKNVHDAGWVHMDLKAENVLLSEDGGTVKLSDFGCAARGGSPWSGIGTEGALAPELLSHPRKCTEKADIWALGRLLCQL